MCHVFYMPPSIFFFQFSFWIHWLFSSMMFNSHILVSFPNSFWWFQNLFHCGQRTCFVLFHSFQMHCGCGGAQHVAGLETVLWEGWVGCCGDVCWACWLTVLFVSPVALLMFCPVLYPLSADISVSNHYDWITPLSSLSVFLHVFRCSLIRYALSF